MKLIKNFKIAVIGLGYVGLPLATKIPSKFKLLVTIQINQNKRTSEICR